MLPIPEQGAYTFKGFFVRAPSFFRGSMHAEVSFGADPGKLQVVEVEAGFRVEAA